VRYVWYDVLLITWRYYWRDYMWCATPENMFVTDFLLRF
jgi:hypothetical protein